MPVSADLVTQCLQPIAGENPSGADLRYDVRLDAIKEARREENLPGAERKLADWGAVVSTTSQLLAKETKDLQLAAWLTEALMRKQGFGGLATGLVVLTGLVEQFWETVYPELEDGDAELRASPLEWVGGKLAVPVRLTPLYGGLSVADLEAARSIPTEEEAKEEREKMEARTAAIDAGRPTPEAVEEATAALNKVQVRALLADLATCAEELTRLDTVCDERFGDVAPSFVPLRTSLDEPRRVLQAVLTQKLETDPDPVGEEPGAEGGEVVAEADGPLTPEPVSAADAAARVAAVTKWMRQKDATNPAPYLILRGFRWGELRSAAPEVEPRLLEAPPTATRARLKALMLDGRWPELLEQGEVLMASAAGRGWLDLQRYVLTACANLGPAYDAVGAVIRSELRALLVALPQLSRMMLMDDTPTANDETREWIESQVMAPESSDQPEEGAPDTDGDAAPSDGSDVLTQALEDDASTSQLGGLAKARATRTHVRPGRDLFSAALAELSQQRPNRAIELLMAELARDPSPRGRFVRQTQIAYVMVEANLDAVARPILERLVETIEERKLEQWEAGPLVAQPIALLHRVLKRAGENSSKVDELYLQVCRLDPMQALALQAS
jgi:type VI secretion system protein ImpA